MINEVSEKEHIH